MKNKGKTQKNKVFRSITSLLFILLFVFSVYGAVSFIQRFSCVDDNARARAPEESAQQTEPEPTQNRDDDWRLKLVNRENPLPADFSPPLGTLQNGLLFDRRAIEPLNAMLAAMRSEGLSPVVASAYRSIEQQAALFENRVEQLMSTGLTLEQAERETARSVAIPGTSEHNLGLAVDLVAKSYQHMTENQGTTPEGRWLAERASEFGFILRYKRDTEHITGIVYEPWHFRYVGLEAAQEIAERGITLEEFLE